MYVKSKFTDIFFTVRCILEVEFNKHNFQIDFTPIALNKSIYSAFVTSIIIPKISETRAW